MAPTRGRTVPSLAEALFAEGYEFEFFQAVRLLARMFPDRKPAGTNARPEEEFIRFVQMGSCPDVREARLSMAFPASAVHWIERNGASGPPARMTVAFFGLTGVQGVLPLCYTEWLMARRAAKDDTLATFFDLFNHRLLSLFYRAWEKHRPAVVYELGAVRGQLPDSFTQYLYDLIGMGTAGLRGRLRVRDESLPRYAGLIRQRPVSASALRGILRDYFSMPVEIEQCLGDWYELEDADRCYLAPELERNQLGEAAFLGAEIWNQQGWFRLRLGPLPLERFLEFLPDGASMAKLVELTTYLAGQAMGFDVQVLLEAEEVPYARLSDEGPDAPRLGWLGWLKTGPFAAAADDAVFRWVN